MQNRGFLVFDTAFSCIIVILMIISAINVSNIMLKTSEERIAGEILILRLYSVSDYVVRDLAAEKTQNSKIPNKISAETLNVIDIEELEEQIGLSGLYIGFESKDKTCISRIILFEGEIKKLYFCADHYESY
ncbi:MAG: hypothetical protein WC501_04740 [Candidatus Micrarchaeia archaeon]